MANPPLVEFVAARMVALTAPGSRWLVAVSGGPDSMALLDLLHRGVALHRRELLVGHVDHGIAPASGAVAELVACAAGVRGLPYVAVRLSLGPDAGETAARRGRRRALRQMARDAGAAGIVLAHQADDQAETVLLRVLHGSGPAGLAAMAARRGVWLRPLLAVPRSELRAHIDAERLDVWDDPANADPRHLRSWLRHEILPALERRLPGVRERLCAVAAQAAAARSAWDGVPELIPALQCRNELHGISVAVAPLRGYRSPVRRAILAALGRRFGVPLGRRRLETLEGLLGTDAVGGRRRLARRLEAELHADRLAFYLVPTEQARPVTVEPGREGTLGRARFEARAGAATSPTRGGWQTTLAPGRYVARAWRRGDRIRPLNGCGSRPSRCCCARRASPRTARRVAGGGRRGRRNDRVGSGHLSIGCADCPTRGARPGMSSALSPEMRRRTGGRDIRIVFDEADDRASRAVSSATRSPRRIRRVNCWCWGC